jgi:hypothetical protein
MSAPVNAVGHADGWLKDQGALLGKRVQAAVAGSAADDATALARRLHDGQTPADIVARKGLPRELIRDAAERRPRGRDRGEESGAGLPALAQALGMTVGQLVSELAKEGVTVKQLFIERGVFPAPGSITDLTL